MSIISYVQQRLLRRKVRQPEKYVTMASTALQSIRTRMWFNAAVAAFFFLTMWMAGVAAFHNFSTDGDARLMWSWVVSACLSLATWPRYLSSALFLRAHYYERIRLVEEQARYSRGVQ